MGAFTVRAPCGTLMAEHRDAVVIGGGFAGLSAAVALTQNGFRVAVLERKPALGGRAYSFPDPDTGDFVDNGQHVLMGCYTETLRFLNRIGTRRQLVFHPDLAIEMLQPGGASAAIRTARLPGPMHMTAAVMRYRHLSVRERTSVIVAGMRILARRRFDRSRLEKMTVIALMDELGQSERARQCFWYPIAIATLNDTPDLSSASLLAEVMKRAFFSGRADSAFVYSKVGLSDLYCAAARRIIEDAGGMVACHTIVESLEMSSEGTIAGVRIRGGERLDAANFIAAVPPAQLLRMLPEGAARAPFFKPLAELSTSPIICVHAWFDREITPSPFVGFIGTDTQWLFNKRRIFEQHGEQHPGYLSFVISGARRLVELGNEELLERVLDDLGTMIPGARGVRPLKALVLKEKQATMAPSPESNRLRPPCETPLPNLFLAGDWVSTGLPATIESAVASGHTAAALISARADRAAA